MNDDYYTERLLEVEAFRLKVNKCGFNPIQEVLNNLWFDKIKNCLETTTNDSNLPVCGEYLAYRWLCEDEQFDYICSVLKEIYNDTRLRKNVGTKIQKICNARYDANEQQAFELSVICRFFIDQVLVDVDCKISETNNKNVDALINICDKEILVEITAFNYYHGFDNTKSGSLCPAINVDKVIQKIQYKLNEQLKCVSKPCVLVIQNPKGRFFDNIQCERVIEKLEINNKLSGILFLYNYHLDHGIWFNNGCCLNPLCSEANRYFQSFLLI